MKWYSVESIESTVALLRVLTVEMIRHMDFHLPLKDPTQIRLITLILKLLLAIMDVVLSSRNGKKLEAIASNALL